MPRAIDRNSSRNSFLRYLSRYKRPALNSQTWNVLLFTHRQADPDALCSAYAISSFLQSRRKQEGKTRVGSKRKDREFICKIVAPQGASTLGINVCKSLSIPFQGEVSPQEIQNSNLIILVDVGNPKLTEPYLESISKSRAVKILLDHHSSTSSTHENGNGRPSFDFLDRTFLDEHATSTCEMVTLEYPKEMLDQRTSLVLLVGLLFDSQHLGIATSSTLRAALKLVKTGGARIDEAKELLRSRPDRSETIARLKSAQRLRFEEIGKKYFLAQSEVSSFHASVARMLIDVGADVGIAYGEQGHEARVSVRASQKFFRETSIDVGSMLGKLSDELGLTGGGHSTAASISGGKPANEIAQSVIFAIKSKIP